MTERSFKPKKGGTILSLKNKGFDVKQIALLVYRDASESAQGRVRAFLSHINKKNLERDFRFRNSPSKSKILGSKTKISGIDYEQLHSVPEKHSETVEKGKASETVFNWKDEDDLVKMLADECYENAKSCVAEKDFDNACRFLELVSRFLKLSQTAMKESDLDHLREEVARLSENDRKFNIQTLNP